MLCYSWLNFILSEECIISLRTIGVNRVKLQIGKGIFNSDVRNRVFNGVVADEGSGVSYDLPVEYYRYKPSIREDIENSLVVVGHCGAGTCLEVLRLGKPFIAVINDTLMNNHQEELALALSEGLHLLHCTPSSLSSTLQNPGLFTLIPFEPPSQKRVAALIDQRMAVSR
ncbi:unnamed protein product [Caenorhabditis auriculariae]|uniref:UDP-N-acetylglucosamine transferase subunit ALG13 n=1 Tax=Caenorhabditis auriculariae TaxID=2777116 RepID=A0A8S1GW15_9PELO|nr:unnamed protein product [Caenorhabditis auriculariae]